MARMPGLLERRYKSLTCLSDLLYYMERGPGKGITLLLGTYVSLALILIDIIDIAVLHTVQRRL